MIFVMRFIFVCSFIFAAPIARAQDDPVSRLLSDAHDSLHQHDEGKATLGRYIWEWARTFDLKGFATGTYRFLNVNLQSPEYRNHAMNLALVLPLSHLTEMTVGPVALYSAHAAGLDAPVQVAIGAAGTLITMPGLDPLCLVFLSSYKFKAVQRTLTESRIAIYKMGRAAGRITSLDKLAGSIFSRHTVIETLEKSQRAGTPLRLENTIDGDESRRTRVTYYRDNEEPLIWLDVVETKSPATGKNVSYVAKVRAYGSMSVADRKKLRVWLRDLGFNSRSGVMDFLDQRGSENARFQSQYHIQQYDKATETVTFRPFTLMLRPKIRLKNCDAWLTSTHDR